MKDSNHISARTARIILTMAVAVGALAIGVATCEGNEHSGNEDKSDFKSNSGVYQERDSARMPPSTGMNGAISSALNGPKQ